MLDHTTSLYLKNLAALAALLVISAGVRGCVTITPASYERGAALVMPAGLSDDDWPVRYPEPLSTLMSSMDRGEDSRVHITQTQLAQISRAVGFFSSQLQYKAAGRGVVCEMPPPADARSRQMVYITNRLPSESFEQLFSSDDRSQAERDKLLRWHFHLQLPATAVPKGTIVHLTSIGDRRYERAVSERLRDRGWAVLHVVPGRIVVPYMHEKIGDAPRQIVSGAEVAGTMDEYAADYAFAVEGVLDYLREMEPSLNGKPLVLTGYSAGALALPTVAARLNGRVDAAVLVGGGANAAGILVNGSITNVVSVLRNSGDGHLLSDLRAMPDAYLKASRFDPYHTAPYLTGKPVLMLQGQLDRIVPPANGDLLYERLNRPERWVYPLGHVPLFWILPSQANRIADWVERAVRM